MASWQKERWVNVLDMESKNHLHLVSIGSLENVS